VREEGIIGPATPPQVLRQSGSVESEEADGALQEPLSPDSRPGAISAPG